MTNDYGNLELHTVLLSAMKDIDRICRENGLRYYLHAGTLLGAMNHKGFIPWDDDVDISLSRSDYERFIEIVQKAYPGKYFLQDYHTDEQYKNNRAVLRVLGTHIIHNHEESAIIHNEIGIDIVPLDHAPDNVLLRRIQQAQIRIYDLAVQIKQGDVVPQSFATKMIRLLSKKNRVKLGEKIDRISMRYNSVHTEMVGLLTYTGRNPYTGRSGYENDLMRREWFENPIMAPFEDTEFMTISDPKADLDHRYGPHWAEPYPEEKRVTKHDVKSYYISDDVRKRVGL